MTDKPKKKMGRPEVALPEHKIIEAASLVVNGGATKSEVQAHLQLSRHDVEKLYEHELFERTKNELRDALIGKAKAYAVAQMSGLTKEALRVLRVHLEKDNLEAAKLVFKAVGVEEPNPDSKDSQIQIILPGQPQEKSIEVEYDSN